MVTVRQLEAFRGVIQHGSVTGAANALGLSQPAISKAVALLEAETGLALFERRNRRLVPTAEALILHGEVDKMFLALTRIVGLSRELKTLAHGQLSVVSTPAMGRNLLPALLAEFLDEHEHAHLSLHLHSGDVVVQWVIAQQVDFGLAWWSAEHPAIVCDLLCEVDGVLVMAPDHPLAKRKTITPEDLRGQPFIHFTRDTRTRLIIERVCAERGVTLQSRIQTYMSESACTFASSGIGVSIVNPFTAHEYRESGDVVVRPFKPTVPFYIYLVRPRNRPRSLLCEAFLDHLRRRFAGILVDQGISGRVQL
jgi:DNA-binding transcriptional LysR family regulator